MSPNSHMKTYIHLVNVITLAWAQSDLIKRLLLYILLLNKGTSTFTKKNRVPGVPTSKNDWTALF